MSTILTIGRNPLARIFAILVILYSIGVPMPWIGRNPCTRYFSAAVYVALPAEACYTMTPNGWHKVSLP